MSITVSNKPATDTQVAILDRAIQLNRGQVRSIGRKAQFLRVISGVAWVTIDGEDIILSGDEETTLEPRTQRGTSPRKSRAVITAVGEDSIVYEAPPFGGALPFHPLTESSTKYRRTPARPASCS